MHPFVCSSEKLFMFFIHDMIIPNACVSVANVFNGFEILFLFPFSSLV